MNLEAIKYLSRLRSILTPGYLSLLSNNIKQSDRIASSLNAYSAFIYVIGYDNYSGLDIMNDKAKLEKHLNLYFGFIYTTVKNIENAYRIAMLAKETLFRATNTNESQVNVIKPRKILTDEIELCISDFHALNIPKNRLRYLNGWQVRSKDGKQFNLDISEFHDKFEDYFTEVIYQYIIDYGRKHRASSLSRYLSCLKGLLNNFSHYCDSVEELKIQLSSNNAHTFFNTIMQDWMIERLSKGLSAKGFFKDWTRTIKVYSDCFIDTKLFDDPITPFLTPKFKEESKPIATISTGGKLTTKEERIWLANIPLHIKDEEVIQIIFDRLLKGEKHVRKVCYQRLLLIKARHERNQSFIKTGHIKPLKGNKYTALSERVYLGNNLKNTVATFNAYGINGTGRFYYKFLSAEGTKATISINMLKEELNLPESSSLFALCILLILEHPQLTPSALDEWRLTTKEEEKFGYKTVGNNKVITVYKYRRGVKLAAQNIILNEKSVQIVKTLADYTRPAREYLKKNPNLDENGDPKTTEWQSMLLRANLNSAESVKKSHAMTDHRVENSPFRQWLIEASSDELNDAERRHLATAVSLRSARNIRGISTYIETRNLRSVAEVLGHKVVNMDILSSYLPRSLLDFFNARWIRQFQNAFIFESMKESDYLFQAIDITEDNLQEFLEHHKINEIPALFERFQTASKEGKLTDTDADTTDYFDEVTFLVTEQLLRVLIAIQTIVEESNEDEQHYFKEIVSVWYQAATYILTSLSLESRNNNTLQATLKRAKSSPLNTNLIRKALIC